jgi:hypothetical protein
MAAEGIPDTMKAAAVAGIVTLSKEKFKEFAVAAERGLALIQAKDYDGLLALLDEVDASPDVIALAKGLLSGLAKPS